MRLRVIPLKFNSGGRDSQTCHPNVHTLLTRRVDRVRSIRSVHTKQEVTFALAAFPVLVNTGDGFAAYGAFWTVRL